MVTYSEEIDLTLELSLDKPHTENAEKFLTTPSSSISEDIRKSLVGNGACEGSSVSSLYKPYSLPLKAEKNEFQDLQTVGRPKDGSVKRLEKIKRLMLQKQNKVEVAKINKEISPTESPAFDRREGPSEVVSRAAASVSKNPAFIRAIAQIKEDLKLCQDLKHKSARGLARGGATSRFLKPPKKEKDPMKPSEWTVKEEMPAKPAETMSLSHFFTGVTKAKSALYVPGMEASEASGGCIPMKHIFVYRVACNLYVPSFTTFHILYHIMKERVQEILYYSTVIG
ncbi:hypothetical protein K1719_047264 [Acacia pycnantha]|nr:hypothetical protein K1719_047264 [Acacia pycnantha]